MSKSVNDAMPIAIDFGTTSSCIATVRMGRDGKLEPVAILDHNDKPKMPTAVYIKESTNEDKLQESGRYLVGFDALEQADSEYLYEGFKRELSLEGGYLRPLPNGIPVSGNALAGVVIRALIRQATQEEYSVTCPVVCHPVGKMWENIIRKIADDIGLKVETLSEPEAALYYAHQVKHIFDERNATVLLIDFGGGTCDFILMQTHSYLWHGIFRPKVHVIDEDRLDFGGKDIDEIICQEFEKAWRRQFPALSSEQKAELQSRRVQYGLAKEAKRVKENLARLYKDGHRNQTERVRVVEMPGDTVFTTTMSAKELRRITLNLIRDKFHSILQNASNPDSYQPLFGERTNVKLQDVDFVLLTGGSNRFPWIKDEILPEFFRTQAREDRIILLPDPELSVAYGAALYAGDLSQGKQRLPRFLQEDLVVELADGIMYPLVKHNTELPLQADKRNAFKLFFWPETGSTILVRLHAKSTHRAAQTRPLSSEPKPVKFSEVIPKGKRMQMRIYIDPKGEVQLSISRAVLWTSEVQHVIFDPLAIGVDKKKDGDGDDF